MTVGRVTYYESVSGEKTEVAVEHDKSDFALKIDGVLYKPAIVDEMEIERSGDMATPQDQCGHTERDRVGDKGWAINVQGIVTSNDARAKNLSMQQMRDVVSTMSEAEIRSDLISGTYEVSDVIISDSSDLFSIQTQDTEGDETAYEFQMQLGQTDSQE
jgi:hypothetical protein